MHRNLNVADAEAAEADNAGRTALMHAAMSGCAQCISRVRRELPASLNVSCNKGNTALHYTVMGGQHAAVMALLEAAWIDFTVQNKEGKTARDLAVVSPELQQAVDTAIAFADSVRANCGSHCPTPRSMKE